MNTFPEITTQRCVLRQITNEDIPALRQIIDDKQFMRFLPELYETLKTNDGLKRFFHIFDIYVRNDDGVLWGLSVSGTLIGFIAIMDVSYDPILFYAVHPQYRNQGFAKEGVEEIVKYYKTYFIGAGLHTEVYEENMASIRILEACGFRDIGRKGKKILLSLQENVPFAPTL